MDSSYKMNQVIGALLAMLDQARSKITWSFGYGQDAARTNLSGATALLARLDSDMKAKVLSSEWTYEKWKGQADLVLKYIKDADATADEGSYKALVGNTFTATAQDVKQAAVIGSAFLIPVLIGLAVLYVVVAARA